MKKTILATAAVALGAGLSWAGSSDAMFSNQLGALNVTSPAKALAAQKPSQPNTGVIVPSETVPHPLTRLSGDALSRLKAKAVEMYRKYRTDEVESNWGFGKYFFKVLGHALPNGAFDITSVVLSVGRWENGFAFTISMNGKIAGDEDYDRTPLEHPLAQKALKQVLENYIGSVQ